MDQQDSLQRSEVAIIGRGVESVLRRLIRFLVGVISLEKLQELINFIYVQEMDEKLRLEQPSRKVTLSTMGMNTGLDTRIIKRIIDSRNYRRGLTSDTKFFRDCTPAVRFLHLWSSDERFVDPETGLPKTLTVRGKTGSLEQLASLLKLPRGVTIKSVVDQLESSELIRHDPQTGHIEMRRDRYLPKPGKDREGALEIGFVAVGRLIDTVLGNLEKDIPDEERLYQRVYWTYRLPKQQRQVFRKKMSALLDEAEKAGYEQLVEMDQPYDMPGQIIAGFGLYLFEEDPEEDEAP